MKEKRYLLGAWVQHKPGAKVLAPHQLCLEEETLGGELEVRTTSPTTRIPLRCWSRKALPAIQMMPQGGENTQKKERGKTLKV